MRAYLAPLIFGTVGCAILLGLGIWQVQRLAWKQDLIARTEVLMNADPVPLPEAPSEEADEYRPVILDGTVLTGELHVITTRRGSGPGFRVIAPFETAQGRRILVERGYVREAEKDADRPTGPIDSFGILSWPDERTFDTPANDVAANYWFARDVAEMGQVLGTEPVLVVNAGPDLPGAPEPMPIGAAYHNRHLEYAVTWFGLAIGWAFMTGLWIVARRRELAEA
ncbi:SURF1 family protein [Roseobacter sp. HKCCA0434]|uniref:SURF1 family protein n=1 Tax=Roseobacter sp. HKCCA0434 TaxID=3079297 RepID=UPI002905EEE9|nr:SURF1 family protein [Roseobacter sp. HKCCA0434]